VCPQCNTEINGIAKVDQEKASLQYVMDNATEIKGAEAEWLVELSSEFLTHKIRKNTTNYEPPLFFRNMKIATSDRSKQMLSSADLIDSEKQMLKILLDLFSNKQFEILEKTMNESDDPLIKQLNSMPKMSTPSLELNVMSRSHQYAAMFLTKILTEIEFKSFMQIGDEIDSLFKKKPLGCGSMIDFFITKGSFKKEKKALESRILDFLSLYRGILPVLLLQDDVKSHNLDEDGISTVSPHPLCDFYKNSYETLCDSIDIVMATNNLRERNDYEMFPDGLSDFSEKMLSYRSKYMKYSSLDPTDYFSNIFLGRIDNRIRNSEGHSSTIYDGAKQMLTFVDTNPKGKERKTNLFLAEMASKCKDLFLPIISIWEIIYQLEKIRLVRQSLATKWS
jgi:hypothetical protein